MAEKKTAEQDKARIGREPLGQILLERKLISGSQLEEALNVQKESSGLLGEILVRLGYVQEINIVVAIVLQCGIPYIAIENYPLAKEVVALIPEDMARRYQMIALDRAGDVLSVVMADPVNTTITKELEAMTACRVAKFIATRTQIAKAISQAYR